MAPEILNSFFQGREGFPPPQCWAKGISENETGWNILGGNFPRKGIHQGGV